MAEKENDNIKQMEKPEDTSLPPDIDEIADNATVSQSKKETGPQLKSLSSDSNTKGSNDIGLITDIPLELTVELGRTKKPIKDILNFGIGTVIELDKIAGEHVELYANGKLLAKGEVVVVEDNFAIKITEIINTKPNMKND